MITELTKEQKDMIPIYVKRWREIGLSTDPCDRAVAEKALHDAYAYMKLKNTAPKIYWFPSPTVAKAKVAELRFNTKTPTEGQMQEIEQHTSYGSFEAYWVAFYSYIAEVLPVKADNLYKIAQNICMNVGAYWALEDAVVCTEKPKATHLKDDKLHNPHGLALEYRDGSGIFAINGERFKSMLHMRIGKEAGKESA